MLTIALPKGRLADQTLDLMEKAGYDVSAARDKSRKLILEDKEAGLRFILSKPSDVPTYVEYGAEQESRNKISEYNKELF